VLWIDSYHPRYGEFWNQKKDCWPRWTSMVGRFWDRQH